MKFRTIKKRFRRYITWFAKHLHGTEYPGRKVLGDDCGTVNFYPQDKLIDVFV